MYPRKIVVGYNKRTDTYSGKLAYVIYRDEKGTLRKEKSWNQWRDKSIDSDEFDNVPTSGFVLNKHAGGYKSGWDYRQSYCRVYDPRGFEFEITIENLLYILDWVDCIHGKGLEGEFVYMWNGYSGIWLEPTCSQEYAAKKAEQDKLFKNTLDLILEPGTEYKLKRPEKINKAVGIADATIIYIGEVSVDRDFGQCHNNYQMFIPGSQANSCGDTDEVFITFKTVENLESVVKPKVLDAATIGNLMDRFELTAYAETFWANHNRIKKFIPGTVNLYHEPALEEYTKLYEKCFYVDPSGEFIHMHIPFVTVSYDYNPYSTDRPAWKRPEYGPNKGYICGGKLTTDLLAATEYEEDHNGKIYTYKQRPLRSQPLYTETRDKDGKYHCEYHLYKVMLNPFICPIKQYKNAKAYFEGDNVRKIYNDDKYIYGGLDSMRIADFEGEHSDCLYETWNGYISDSITRLNLFNHLNVTTVDHIATVMTLPYKIKA